MSLTLIAKSWFKLQSSSVLALFVLGAAAWGDPPSGYYDPASGLAGAALKAALHNIIDDHQRYPYTDTVTDTWNILEQADEDPGNPSNVLDLYRNHSFPKSAHEGTVTGGWNREHTWPKSYGFPDDGTCNYPYTDCHHLMACDTAYNAARDNNPFADCPGGTAYAAENTGLSNFLIGERWEVWDGRKGDVARAILYMDVRYEGGTHGTTGCAEPDLRVTNDASLIVTSSGNSSVGYMGMLSTLLEWSIVDPVDADERLRNDLVFSYQGNRNPFIDHPEWICQVFGGECSTPPQTGSLQVALTPQAAVEAGAQWRVDGGVWHNSGDTVSHLAAGAHLVEFTEVGGWIMPAEITVQIGAGQVAAITGSYAVVSVGSVAVTFVHPRASGEGCRWRIDAGEWQTSGNSVAGLAPGAHWLEFNEATGWISPLSQDVEIVTNETAHVKANFMRNSGPELTGTWKAIKQKSKRVYSLKGQLAIRNEGTQDCGAFEIGFYLAGNPDNSDGVLLERIKVPRLKTGKTVVKSLKSRLAEPASGKFVVAILDDLDSVDERDESARPIAASIP